MKPQTETVTPVPERRYQADDRLLLAIVGLVQRLRRECYFCDVVLIAYTFVMYNLNSNSADIPTFILLELAIILFLGVVQYFLIYAKGQFVTHTAIDINFTEEHIEIVTAAFMGPFWFKKPSKRLRLKRSQVEVVQGTNPFKRIFKEQGTLVKLRYGKKKEVYVMTNHFSSSLDKLLHSV